MSRGDCAIRHERFLYIKKAIYSTARQRVGAGVAIVSRGTCVLSPFIALDKY